MPRKSDIIPINNPKLDKRVKLTDEQRNEIHANKQGLSQRKLAKAYGVSRRLITFILDPEKAKKNRETRQAKGGSKFYYNKEKHTKATKKHRDYKKELFNNNLIGNNDETN